MDAQEIRTLLGKSIFERAQKYRKRILQSSCTTNEDGVRHLTALVQGSGPDCYYTQVWLRENGSFVSASCDCPYNQNGDGTYCKHIGALLLQDAEKNPPAPEKKPESIPGVQRGVAGLSTEPRKDSYSAGLDMLFGRKWRGEEPETDYEAQLLLKRYQRGCAAPAPERRPAHRLCSAGTGAYAAQWPYLAAAAGLGRHRRAAVSGKKHPAVSGCDRAGRKRQLREIAGLCAPVGRLCSGCTAAAAAAAPSGERPAGV